MPEHDLESRLRRALAVEAADFEMTTDIGAIRERLAEGRRRERSVLLPWLRVAAVAAIAILGIGVFALAPGSGPTVLSPSPSPVAASASVAPSSQRLDLQSPVPIGADAGWRVAIDRSGIFDGPDSEPMSLELTMPADATRWGLKVSCTGFSPLVITTPWAIHTAACPDPSNGVSRAVYAVGNDQISGPSRITIQTAVAAAFQVIVETTTSALGDPLTIDPTPGPSTFQSGPEVPLGPFPPIWTVSGASTPGGSDRQTTYFNDHGAPTLHVGPVTIIVACIGSGRLTVALGTANGPGGSPVTFATGESQAIDCDEASSPVTAQLARPATGQENAISTDGIAADPMAGFSWSLALGQPSR